MEKVFLKTDHAVAFDSADHLYPCGTAKDNSNNKRFNSKLFRLFKEKPKVLDLGCSGGAFVKACLSHGSLAVGLEGSDFSKKRKRAAWKFYTDKCLFTCDITRPFILSHDPKFSVPIKFHVITAWEVFEHLPEERLDMTIRNMQKHLADDGLIILSIATWDFRYQDHSLHICLHPKSWWLNKFAEHGLYPIAQLSSYFNNQYIRGPKQGNPDSFLLHLSKNPANFKIPRIGVKERLNDWFCSTKIYQNVIVFPYAHKTF